MEPLLQVNGLQVQFNTPQGSFNAVRGVNFTLHAGELLGIVGESGCGKSVTSLSIMGLLPQGKAQVTAGEIIYNNQNLLALPNKQMNKLRGRELAMIFQDPLSSLDPLATIEAQLTEGLRIHLKLAKKAAKAQALALLESVGIQNPAAVLQLYPHQLSGGMIQRVMIAIGFSCNPGLLIADEPTTALDVTVQAQVLALMNQLRQNHNTAILLVTHNMGVVAQMCDRVLVMYAGEIVEQAATAQLFNAPSHPYTQGLLKCIPSMEQKQQKLYSIPGMVPFLSQQITGCAFAPRCPHCTPLCQAQAPPDIILAPGHNARCHYAKEVCHGYTA